MLFRKTTPTIFPSDWEKYGGLSKTSIPRRYGDSSPQINACRDAVIAWRLKRDGTAMRSREATGQGQIMLFHVPPQRDGWCQRCHASGINIVGDDCDQRALVQIFFLISLSRKGYRSMT